MNKYAFTRASGMTIAGFKMNVEETLILELKPTKPIETHTQTNEHARVQSQTYA